MEKGDSQFNLNCTNFTEAQLKVINLTRSIMALHGMCAHCGTHSAVSPLL